MHILSPSQAATLSAIELNPNTTPRTRLLIARRVCRALCAKRQSIYDERQILRRQAVALRRFLPFTKDAVETLEQQATNHRDDELAGIRRCLVLYGQLIVSDPDNTAAALGFDGLCDALNINPTHREQALHEGGSSVYGLALIAQAEDSAERGGRRRGDDGPLSEACQAALFTFIRTAPGGLLPDPLAPGGPFYGAPVRVLNQDGSVSIKRPDLVVHDAGGRRVVRRPVHR